MAKYRVLKPFRDIETGEDYEANQEIEMTVKRANEATENLKKWDGEFLERIDNKKQEVDILKDEDTGSTEDDEGDK